MRIVQFFDGAQSETTPTIGNIKASGLVEYANDAAYESNEQGAPAEGNIYFNTTSNLIRYYNGTNWIDVVDRETAQAIDNKTIDGTSNGTNTVLTVADNVEVTPAGNLASTNTQDALEELQGDINALDARLDTAEADIIDLQNDKENKSEKGQPNGYAPLDSMNLIPAIHIPGFADDVVEYANFASFPVVGETGKIYVDISTNFQYRWSGSIYVQLSNSPVSSVNGQTGIVVLDVDDINDVTLTAPQDNDVLTYDTGTSEWVNAPVPRSLGQLSDVDLSTPPVNGNALVYNGTDWVAGQGSGGQGVRNFIEYGDAELGSLGWTAYKDAAQARPVDGTGGSPTGVGFLQTTSKILDGDYSFLFSKIAANHQGEGVSYNFTIPIGYQAKVLTIEMLYEVVSGTFVAGSSTTDSDLIVYIYDVTNSQLIEPSSFKFFSNSSTIADKFSATFQTSATGTQYRLILHQARNGTNGYELAIDNITVSPSQYVYGTPITDWQSYTPTITHTSGAATNYTVNARWRRIGQNIQVTGRALFSNVSASFVNFIVSLPSGLSIDLVNTTTNILGRSACNDATFASYPGNVLYNSTTNVLISAINASLTSAQSSSITQANPFTFNSTDSIDFDFSVPIVGWSSSVQMSDSFQSRNINAYITRSGNQTGVNPNNSYVKVLLNNVVSDDVGGFDIPNSRYIIQSSGDYVFTGSVSTLNTNVLSGYHGLAIYRNGSKLQDVSLVRNDTANIFLWVAGTTTPVKLNAGDIIELYFRGLQNNSVSTLTIDSSYLGITKIQGPSAIAASESVNLKYRNTAGTSIPSGAGLSAVPFATLVYDSHNSWNGTTFTAPISGKYRISCHVYYASASFTTANPFSLGIRKNGTIEDFIAVLPKQAAFTNTAGIGGSVDVDLLAGNTITIDASHNEAAARALNTQAGTNWICIARVGN